MERNVDTIQSKVSFDPQKFKMEITQHVNNEMECLLRYRDKNIKENDDIKDRLNHFDEVAKQVF